jgi:hypothetical protein
MEGEKRGLWQQDLADFVAGLDGGQRARLMAIVEQFEPRWEDERQGA